MKTRALKSGFYLLTLFLTYDADE